MTTLQAGVGNMVDANMTAESAKLSALQVQQQLGTPGFVDRQPGAADPDQAVCQPVIDGRPARQGRPYRSGAEYAGG